MTPIIRAATLQDHDILARLHRKCFDEAWDEESFRLLLQNPGAFALLAGAADETAFACFVLIQIAADQAEVLSIGTVPSARRMGLAMAILQAAMAEAGRRNAQAMFLEVADDNPAALSLYAGLGFELTGRRRAYYSRSPGLAADALMLRAILQRN
jgi:[ribosomal protein S18]-alanine N-acetyltransferase